MYERKIILGFIRVHILHHAKSDEGIYGVELIKELATHGYKISPGTLYPILHEMEKNSLLEKKSVNVDGKIRKVYTITKKGLQLLENLKNFVSELFTEVI
jgi:DNA-binding PadR family transcriptional regulator